ncbi:surface lipoprotein assembly modifier [Sphingosinicella soli]|uniref:Surface lipoprotein assembly modifier C-terminal domain-containing protein n=1 Tax=Sphingosinicella soli TaxID=333708 RepID=A0A7W7B1A6_9SPHN|nr:surface lipoprotein assembly modifier [Sphingosinicella soli]MBB4631173.1 hypothetical protein [Sphingosinicella soli]
MFKALLRLGALLALACPVHVSAQSRDAEPRSAQAMELSAAQLFDFAKQAQAADDIEAARTAYLALAKNPDIEIRTEARFRLAMMLSETGKQHREAAVLLREILDEKPNAARVRVELARIQALMGNIGAAERELRAAQAAGLPPEIEPLVRFYAQALGARKPFGGSLEVAFAPDSNINRATRSETLGTVIGDFDLSRDARETSGLGVSLRGQAYARAPIDPHVDILLRASGAARVYRDGEFDDYAASLQAGPQVLSGTDKISLAGLVAWRWYGRKPYEFSYGLSANVQHPLGRRGQMRVDGAATRSEDRRSSLRDADRYSLSVGIDRAFTSRFGGGVQVSGLRQTARDPGYSTASGGIGAYLFLEMGKVTSVLSAKYEHLEADRRLFLYPKRRVDDRYEIGLSATLRKFRVGSFAPILKLSRERNVSTIELYDYTRVSGEVGVTAAF